MKKWQYVLIGVFVLLIPAFLWGRKRTSIQQIIKSDFEENKSGESRNVRNNNAGNIKISNSAWIGKVPNSKNTDGTFEQFYEKKFGDRAMIKLIRNYIKSGYDTLDKIVSRWAPNSENPTSSYKLYVVNESGLMPDEQIGYNDKEKIESLVMAMADFEALPQDRPVITEDQFEQAYAIL